jgi:hypothetical protein
LREAEWAAFNAQAGVIGGLRGGAEWPSRLSFAPVAGYARARRWPPTLATEPQTDGFAPAGR